MKERKEKKHQSDMPNEDPYDSFVEAINYEVNRVMESYGYGDYRPRREYFGPPPHHLHAPPHAPPHAHAHGHGHHHRAHPQGVHAQARGHKGGRHGRRKSGNRELHRRCGEHQGDLTTDLDNWYVDDDWTLLPSEELDTVGITPPVDLLENEKNYALNVTIPGIQNKNSVNVEYHRGKNQIFISGEVPSVLTEENRDRVRVQETAFGKFRRVISLPDYPGIDADNIKADYSSGVLHLDIPKLKPTEPKQGVQTIEVSSHDSWDK